MEFELCTSLIKVDLGLNEGQELNLLSCYNILKSSGFNPNYESTMNFGNLKPLRFQFNDYYFNVFHTGKITVFTKIPFNEKKVESVLNELQNLIFKKSVVSTMISK